MDAALGQCGKQGKKLLEPWLEVVSSLIKVKLPKDWRVANVSLGNYWPVSPTSVVGKLLEGILRDIIHLHLKTFCSWKCYSPYFNFYINLSVFQPFTHSL